MLEKAEALACLPPKFRVPRSHFRVHLWYRPNVDSVLVREGMGMSLDMTTLDALWRPFTQHALQQAPMVMVEGRGATLIDADGNEYIDGMAGLWCVNVGYGQERLVEAAARQM